jgi:hypothetical protein
MGKLHLQLHLIDILEATDMMFLSVFYELKNFPVKKTGIFVGISMKIF